MTADDTPTPRTEEWTYSSYRATLYRKGARVAILTPDGINSLDEDEAKELCRLLNRGDTLERELAAKEAELAAANWLLSKVNTAAWDALKAENATLRQRVRAAEELAKSIDDCGWLEEYPADKDGRRQWANHASTWLYPGDKVVVVGIEAWNALAEFRATEGRAG